MKDDLMFFVKKKTATILYTNDRVQEIIEEWKSCKAVSYTHLDVYKRQE